MRRFYLSRYAGLGTDESPFNPRISSYGKTGCVDLRPDVTKSEGWAVCCLETGGGGESPPVTDAEILLLTDDANANLAEETRSQISRILQVEFLSTTLRDIILEILLLNRIPGRGLRPDVDGEYRLYVGSLIASLSEEQAIAFVGDLIDKRDRFTPPPITPGDPKQVVSGLTHAMGDLRHVVEHRAPGWLDQAMRRYRTHPMVRTYVDARTALAAGYEAVSASPDALEIAMLARDIRLLQPQLNLGRLASRLRDPKDCKAAVYELYVIAGYAQARCRD